MKNTFLFLIFFLLMIACQPKQEKNSVTSDVIASTAVIEVYDFHVTNRCMTCRAIEDNARQTLTKHFKEELQSGIIAFQVVNVDLSENAALAEQFQAYGSSLYLKINKDNKSEIVNLTDFAFMNAMNEESFQTELKSKIQTYL